MERDQILDKLKAMLQERFSIDPTTVHAGTHRSEMGLDSILMVDLMLDVETELGLSFDTMELPPDPTLGDVADLVARNLR